MVAWGPNLYLLSVPAAWSVSLELKIYNSVDYFS